MKNCLDCLFCKINGIKKLIRCSLRNWEYDSNGNPRTIKLTSTEALFYDINQRKKFNTAIYCQEFSPMDDLENP